MNPAKLRHRVTLQEKLEEVSLGKRATATWISLPARWAAIEPLAGRELEYARQMVADATHEVMMRYTDEITTAMRLEYAGRHFQIQHIADSGERREEMRLICTERT
jgi:SPP1 family predicted phage head-tail adaptor